MGIYQLGEVTPEIHESAFVADTASIIGRDCLVGAGALVTEGKVFPDRSLIIGTPARVLRELSEAEIAGLRANTADYAARRAIYKEQLVRIG